ncbi:MAG: FtsL-like putative cell division protein [Paludibacter sp.]|mgnify:CR=1 FL=1
MSFFKRLVDNIKGNEDFNDLKSSTLRDIINGNILTKKFLKKQYPLLIMIAILAFLYVDNRYYCEKQLSKVLKLKRELQDIKYESLTLSAELMETSRQSSIRKMVKERGLTLKESSTPPVVIDLNKETKQENDD